MFEHRENYYYNELSPPILVGPEKKNEHELFLLLGEIFKPLFDAKQPPFNTDRYKLWFGVSTYMPYQFEIDIPDKIAKKTHSGIRSMAQKSQHNRVVREFGFQQDKVELGMRACDTIEKKLKKKLLRQGPRYYSNIISSNGVEKENDLSCYSDTLHQLHTQKWGNFSTPCELWDNQGINITSINRKNNFFKTTCFTF